MTNPLLLALAECRHLGDDAVTALVKLHMVLRMSDDFGAALAATEWHLVHGEPTYERLEEWAAAFAGDLANAELMARLRARHAEFWAGLPAADRERLAGYLPGAGA
jgi:hypothetical protein